jgi:hypothetical protein
MYARAASSGTGASREGANPGTINFATFVPTFSRLKQVHWLKRDFTVGAGLLANAGGQLRFHI